MKVPCLGGYLILVILIHTSSSLYVFEGNPFQQFGPLVIGTKTLNELEDGIPVHTEVYYPNHPGSYTPILFIPGFNGAVYPSFYSTAATNFASYGYVVAALDLNWPTTIKGMSGEITRRQIIKTDAERSFQTLQWLENHLVQKVLPGQMIFNVTVDWKNLGILSHSSGADTLIQMLQKNHTFAKAAAFLEPFSNHLNGPLVLPHLLPTLSYGTELCMEFPYCCIKGLGYLHIYQNLICPKILMNIAGYGHCDILNEYPGWDLCHASDFCKTEKDNNRRLYREVFVPGVLSSFFGQYLQGNPNLVHLITHQENMPIRLQQLQSELNCTLKS